MCDSEKNRLLRLKQVRLQSKDIAQNIRERVANEKRKQEERIQAQKVEEAGRWKKRYFQEKGKQYATSLSHVGEAHSEAEKEKLLPAVPRKVKSRPNPRITSVADKGRDIKKKSPEKVMKKITTKAIQTSPREVEEILISSDSSSSTLVDDLQLLSSSDSIDISHPRVPESPPIQLRKEIPIEKHPQQEILREKNCFSQVSTLVKKRCSLKDNEFGNFERLPTNWGIQSRQIVTKSPPLRNMNHLIRETIPMGKEFHENAMLPQRSEPQKDSKIAAKLKRKKITESPRQFNQKVHYYDHPNRFHKTYVPPANAVVKAGPSRSQNAFQNAREEVFREKNSSKMKDIEEMEKNRVQNIRSAQALAKERMRRQYESLLGKVDELIEEENSAANPTDAVNPNEDIVERSEDEFLSLDAEKPLSEWKEKKTPNDCAQDDLDVDLLHIMERILKKLDENRVQTVEEILSKIDRKDKEEKTDDRIEKIITQTKEIGVQSHFTPPERDTSESTVDQVEIQTVGQTDKVEVVSMKKSADPKKKSQIQIVINVKDNGGMNNLGGMTEEAIQTANNEKRKRSMSYKNLSDAIGKKYPKTPEKKGKILVDTISSIASESSTSTAYHSPPSALYNDIAQFMRRIEQEVPLQKVPGGKGRVPAVPTSKESEKQSALLRKYITRLLEMPRADVDVLSVSSGTEIPTPNASVVNVSTNVAEEPQRDIQKEPKMTKKSKKTSTKPQILKQIPIESTSRQARESRRDHEMNIPQRKVVEKERNLPKPEKPKPESKTTDVQQPDLLRMQYANYTEKYMKRILKLSKLISQVRNEKNRLIADNPQISSGSDNGLDTSTKYKDFPHRAPGESSTDMSSVSEMKSSSSAKDDGQMAGNGTNLTACRTIGLSKDSGISISRPVTATEMRDSPEVRLIPLKRTEKTKLPLEENATRRIFDTSKPGTLKSTTHELSTIAELDTSRVPGSSVVGNQSNVEEAFRDLKEAIARISSEFDYKRIPSLEEYIQRLAESLHEQSGNVTGQEKGLLEYFKDLSREMIFPKFPSYREFLQQEGATGGVMESIDLEAASDNAVSEFSLPDVVAELIQRNVMEHPFRNSPEPVVTQEPHDAEGGEKQHKNIPNKSIEVQPSSSSSSINLEADFRRVGLRWAANMLEKTHEHQQMSSSDSSTQLNLINPNIRTPLLNLPVAENSFVDPNIGGTRVASQPALADDSQSTGKPLNLLEFLNRELEKKSTRKNVSSIDGSTHLNSLFLDSTDGLSPKENQIQRTSTPVTGSKMLADRNLKNSSTLTNSTESKLSSIDSR